MRELLLMRHANASWPEQGGSDFTRPLSHKGQQEAKQIGQWLAQQAIPPHHIICSPAQRTCETLGQLKHHITINQVNLDERSYLASLQTLLLILSESPTHSITMLLTHNTGAEELLTYLCGKNITKPSDSELMPPAALARIQLPDDWSELHKLSGKLTQLIHPKNLEI